jgi:DNA mismatch repair protein MutL
LNEIHILPDFIANQIAAGEVVQRPESVVKELVENSMDSGADSIAVVVRNAGKQLIHVIDNGSGIHKDDLPLTIKRHATSKIISQEDMEQILTYGFRGEALASISSVAQLEIRSKRQGEDIGFILQAEPNNEAAISPVNIETGTQVFVKNLFYNIPARRKFLKSNLTEFRHISDTMMKFALSRTDIRFTFYDADTLIFDVKPSSLENRVKELLGDTTANNMIPVLYSTENIEVSGFIGEPQLAKQSGASQYLFLNGRSIRSKYLNHAVIMAYEFLIDKNHYPFYLLNIKVDPKFIDVNVHPQKHEVKFEDERFVYNIVHRAISNALNSRNLIPDISLVNNEISSPFFINRTDSNTGNREIINKMTGEIIEPYPKSNYETNKKEHDNHSFSFESRNSNVNRFNRELSAYEALFGNKEDEEISEKSEFSNIKQVLNNYILVETSGSMLLIEQKRAHTRILYEKQIKKIEGTQKISQSIMYPIELELTSQQIAIIEMIREYLEKFGYDFTSRHGKVIITGLPQDIKKGYEAGLFLDLINGAAEGTNEDRNARKHRMAMVYASRSSVDSNTVLSQSEALNIYKELNNCTNMNYTPDGKRIFVELTIDKINQLFG